MSIQRSSHQIHSLKNLSISPDFNVGVLGLLNILYCLCFMRGGELENPNNGLKATSGLHLIQSKRLFSQERRVRIWIRCCVTSQTLCFTMQIFQDFRFKQMSVFSEQMCGDMNRYNMYLQTVVAWLQICTNKSDSSAVRGFIPKRIKQWQTK